MTRRFVDTNVLLYSVSRRTGEAEKARVAADLLESSDLAFSVQVFQEFYTQVTRVTNPDALPHRIALDIVESLKRFPVQPMTIEVFDAALATKERYGISYWDAAIVEAARALGCATIVTEDLADGHTYNGIRIVNPFTNAA